MAEQSDADKTRTHVVLTSGTQVLHYRIVDKIGAGGMGEVYLADDTELDRRVALKFLPPQLCQDEECRKRFKREAQAAAKLDHPNIVTVYEVGEYQGRPFFAMAHVEGQSLREYAHGKDLEIERVVNLAIQICDGLGAAHNKQVIHRDIKPSNIVIDAYGRPKILDFGLATVKGGEHLTKTGSTLGTVRYMSPEQVQGKEVDHRTDLFSLGVVLYEMVTGHSPFARDNDMATAQAIVSDTPDPLAKYRASVPEPLQAVISKLLEKDPNLRYQSAAGVLPDLRKLRRRSDSDTAAYAPSQKSRRRFMAAAIAAVCVVVVAAAYFLFGDRFIQTGGHSGRDISARWTNSIAVLPFRDFSTNRDQESFCDGMTDAIIGKLSGIDELKVTSLTSVLRYKSDDRDIKKIGEDLGVEHVLEGTIQREGGDLRVRAQLIRVDQDAHLWSETYDRQVQGIFGVQDDISRAIVGAMKLKLAGSKEVSLAKHSTNNSDAYEAYVQGRHFWRRRSEEGIRKAIEYFETAIQLDPDYALAYSGLADAWMVLPNYSSLEDYEVRPDALKAAEKAIALDDELAEAHASMGLVVYETDYQRGEAEFLRAIELNPGYVWSYVWYSNMLNDMGRREESLEQLEIAYALDPVNTVTVSNLGVRSWSAGDFEAAEKYLYRVLEIDFQPGFVQNYGNLLSVLYRYDSAVSLYEHAVDHFPENPEINEALWQLHAQLGRVDSALRLADVYSQAYKDAEFLAEKRAAVRWAGGNLDSAILEYQHLLQINAASSAALESLTWLCSNLGRCEEALDYANRYVESHPEWSAAWNRSAQTKAICGLAEATLKDVERARDLNPGHMMAGVAAMSAYLFLDDFKRVQEISSDEYMRSDDQDWRGWGTYGYSCALAAQGRFHRCLDFLDSCLTADSLAGRSYLMYQDCLLRVFVYEVTGNLENASRENRRLTNISRMRFPGDPIAWRDYQIFISAQRGAFDEAESLADTLRRDLEAEATTGMWPYWYGKGAIAFERADYEEAIGWLKKAADSAVGRATQNFIQSHLLLARAYLEAGKTELAISEYEVLTSNAHWLAGAFCVQLTEARYHLGRAYELAGRNRDAVAQYEKFLRRWGDADVRLASVEDARARLARLKPGS